MKLNQKGTMALPLTLIITGILAGAAYYNTNFSQISSEAIHSDLGRGETADSLDKYLREKASDLKFKIGSILSTPTILSTNNIHNILTTQLISDDQFKCQANPDMTNSDHIVSQNISTNYDVLFLCKEIRMNQKEGYLLEARISHKGTIKPKYKKAFVAARIPVGYMTLTRNSPTRENNFLKPYLLKSAISKSMPVYLHDKITTGISSFAHITMLDDTILNIGPNSEFQIDAFELTDKTNIAKRTGIYNLINGFIRANFTKRSDNNLTIKTKTVAMGIRGTTFTIWTGLVNGKPTTSFNLLEGKVELLENNGDPLDTPVIMDAGKTEIEDGTIGPTPEYVEVQKSGSNSSEILVRKGQLTNEKALRYDQFKNEEMIMNIEIEEYNQEVETLIANGQDSIKEYLDPERNMTEWETIKINHPALMAKSEGQNNKSDDKDDDEDKETDDGRPSSNDGSSRDEQNHNTDKPQGSLPELEAGINGQDRNADLEQQEQDISLKRKKHKECVALAHKHLNHFWERKKRKKRIKRECDPLLL